MEVFYLWAESIMEQLQRLADVCDVFEINHILERNLYGA